MTDRPSAWSLAVVAGALVLSSASLAAQEADYPTEPPPPMEAADVELPSPVRDTLDNGLELVVVENHEQPVVSVRLYVPGGQAADPGDKSGLASLTSRVLDKGTEERSASEIASTVEGMGASLSTGASEDYAFVASSSLTRHAPDVLEVFSDVVRNPTFPGSELENERKRMKSSLQQQLSQPSALASRHFSRIVYGDHPYGDAATPESVEAIRRGDMVRFHRERYVPEGSLLVFAGDVTPRRAREMARTWFGDWQGSPPADAGRPAPPSRDSARIYLVHRPGSEQSVIRMGHLGIEPGSEDAHALEVANRVLGGGANARLFLILREEKGWTYGAYSSLTRRRDQGIFAAQAEVRNAVTDSALNELVDQVQRLRRELVPEEEMVDARTYLTGSFPLRLETPQQVASRVAEVLLLGLDVDYLERYRSRISRVDASDVRAAAREHLHPDRAAIVVVGDARKVHGDLSSIGPVTLLDVQGEELALSDLEVQRSDVSLDASRMRTGEFGYRLVFQGNAAGQVTIAMEKAGEDRYRMRQEVSLGGAGQTVTATMTRDLTPISAVQKGRMGPNRDLTYEDGRVTGTARVPDPEAGDQGQPGRPPMKEVTVDTAVAAGTIDGTMDMPAVLSAALSEGAEFRLPTYAPASGVTQLTARVTGRETVDVPAGSFETWVVEVSRPQQTVTLYVTRESPHLLVKQEIAGQPVTLELESVGGAGGGASGG